VETWLRIGLPSWLSCTALVTSAACSVAVFFTAAALPAVAGAADPTLTPVPPTPTPTVQTESLTGTIQYTGHMGPVSATHPMKLILFTNSDLFRLSGQGVAAAMTVTNNPGSFALNVPTAGNYYLMITLVVTSTAGETSVAAVGDPYQIYDQQYTLPAAPITVPQSEVSLSFDDTWLLSGIAGTVQYNGNLGQVSSTQNLMVLFFTDPGLTQFTQHNKSERITSSGGRYDHLTWDNNTYYPVAFFDLNGDQEYEPGEPFAVFNGGVEATANQFGINFVFGDENVGATPAPNSPTPTATKTPGPCIGNCGNDGQVTVDDILTLVNIALGNRSVSDCQAGDFNGDNQITVDEILKAVNAALNGCVVSPAEQGCLNSGGTVRWATCCTSASDFPNTCATGACGCGPGATHEVRICNCPAGSCFDASACVPT
jgi:hypothetical protein